MGGNSYKTLIVILCCLVSCVKDKPAAGTTPTPGAGRNVYIVCEGRFTAGDASLSAYQPAIDSVYTNLFKTANSQSLGDVFQSMVRIGSRLFLCVNNSDKVVVVDAGNYNIAGTIIIPKPRYILQVSATRAYVSSEYSNRVYVIDPQALIVTDTIKLAYQNTEGMCLWDNYAMICTWDTTCNVIFKVDINTNKVVQTIKLSGYAPHDALIDKDNMLWVLSGNHNGRRASAWTRIDPSSGNILNSYNFSSDVDAIKPVFNNTKDTLYFIEADYNGGTANNGIYYLPAFNTTLIPTGFLAAKQFQYFWALGIEPITGNIYIGDPKFFQQKGTVYVYGRNQALLKSFSVGIGPGRFYFDD